MSIHSCVEACESGEEYHYLIKEWNEQGKWPRTNEEVARLLLEESARWQMLAFRLMATTRD